MKKLIVVVLAIVMVFSIAACGQSSAPAATQAPAAEAPAAEAPAAEAPAPEGFVFNRRIEVMTPSPEGSNADITLRKMADLLSAELGVDVIVTDMPGASGVTGYTWAKDQQHDGYFYQYTSPSAIGSAVLGNFDFDFLGSITPMCSLLSSKDVFFTSSKNSKFSDFDSLKEYALANPGKVTIAVQSTTGIDGASMGEFLAECGFDLKIVNYEADATTACLSGEVDLMMSTYGENEAYIESGDMLPLIVLSDKRQAELPDVPCTVEVGIDATLGPWFGFTCFNDTPVEAKEAFEAAVAKVAEGEEWQNFLLSLGYNVDFRDEAGFTELLNDTATIMADAFSYFANH